MTIVTTARASAGFVAAAPWRPFRVVVARTQRLSPTFLRITFTGGDLDEFGHDGPDQRVKLYVPPPGAPVPDLQTADWRAHLRTVDPAVRGVFRTYTIRAVRPELREVDVDFVLHGDNGPASRWASRAHVGQEVALIGPNRLYGADCRGYEWNPPVQARDVLVVGDETALPAVSGILESLHRSGSTEARLRVLLEVPTPADIVDLPAPGHAEITWLPRHGRGRTHVPHGVRLIDAVRASRLDIGPRPLPTDHGHVDTIDIDLEMLWEIGAGASSDVYAWVAGEAAAVRAVRRHLVRERGIDKRAVTFMGYWRIGRAGS